jgi:hypothetical protein
VIWAVRDASRRCANPRLRLAVTVGAIVFPVVGAAVYALARPCDDRIERRSQRLRIALLEAALEGTDAAERCSACSEPLEPEFRCCPGCGEPAHVRCEGCESFVRATWTACPWCAQPIAPAAYAKIRRSSRARVVAA